METAARRESGAGCGWPRTKSGWKPSEVSMGSTLPSGAAQAAGSLDENLLPGLLGSVQQDLLVVGTELMAPSREVPARTCPALPGRRLPGWKRLSRTLRSRLPELRDFIVPGGTETAARLHLSRAVCRRAAR